MSLNIYQKRSQAKDHQNHRSSKPALRVNQQLENSLVLVAFHTKSLQNQVLPFVNYLSGKFSMTRARSEKLRHICDRNNNFER